jgi:hypothetical protein
MQGYIKTTIQGLFYLLIRFLLPSPAAEPDRQVGEEERQGEQQEQGVQAVVLHQVQVSKFKHVSTNCNINWTAA